jgi:hypothetical protein
VVVGLDDVDPDHPPYSPLTPYGLMTQHGLSSLFWMTASLSAVAVAADENKSTNIVPTDTSANLNLTTIITSPQEIGGRKGGCPSVVLTGRVQPV